jgi:hypothetical protein
MTDREKQKRLDRLAMQYLTAVEAGDFNVIGLLWAHAEMEQDAAEMLHGLNAELLTAHDTEMRTMIGEQIIGAIEAHMPSAEVARPGPAPVTVATVAEYIRKKPPRGLTTDELRLNDMLRQSTEALPAELGVAKVIAWGRRFGNNPEAYWKAFRAAALKLLMEVESAQNYQMAARPRKPKTPEGTE